jgi:hypothetical protein
MGVQRMCYSFTTAGHVLQAFNRDAARCPPAFAIKQPLFCLKHILGNNTYL